MAEKCQSHDQCFDRVNDMLAAIRNEIRQNHDDVRNMLHAGAIIHAQYGMRLDAHDVELKEIEDELKALEGELKGRGTDWKGLIVKLLFGLLEKGIIVVIGMAWWAHMNGFGK